MSTQDLSSLQTQLGIDSWNDLKIEDFSKMQELIVEDKITKKQVSQLFGMIPNFIDLQKELLSSLQTAVQANGNSQDIALQQMFVGYRDLVTVLNTLSSQAETEDLRGKIADIIVSLAQQNKELVDLLVGMNKENNTHWMNVTKTLGSIFSITAGAVFVILKMRK